jgi:hypothetical protein
LILEKRDREIVKKEPEREESREQRGEIGGAEGAA